MMMTPAQPRGQESPWIAYFSMEIGLRNDIPTYSGGLGVLAGDTIKSAADLSVPMVAVTLLHRQGYFEQKIVDGGRQSELPVDWDPARQLDRVDEQVIVRVAGREVRVGAWRLDVKSFAGGRVPVIFLDTDLAENDDVDRRITDSLYGGDDRYRLSQEIVLGIGGVLMLDALGYEIEKYHLNEGHAALLTLELLRRKRRPIESVWDERLVWDPDTVRDLCVFTTHTPVEAGHDQFDYELVDEVLGDFVPRPVLKELGGEDRLNMTKLALNLSRYVNGVAKKHGEVSQNLFPGYEIHAITNGIHSFTWTCRFMATLFDKWLPGWANEPELFVRATSIPDEEVRAAHLKAKRDLIQYVKKRSGVELKDDVLTLGFARRMTAYKRADLLLSDPERLLALGEGKLQIVYAGKAHPRDEAGKDLIYRVHEISRLLGTRIPLVFLENYNMDQALKIVSGVDVWVNTPLRPREASGTSGMKAAHNGVPNFSILDGWWIEGHMEGVTGWSIGPPPVESDISESLDSTDAESLYTKLENELIPLYYERPEEWLKVMKGAIALNAYYFNTHRMMRRYVTEAYLQ